MKIIYTSKGQEIFVDDEDYESLSKYSWWISNKGYVLRSELRNGKRYGVRMHRQILGLDKDDPVIVDHRNGIRHDNQRSNLRACDYFQNAWNYRKPSTNTTGLKGASLRNSGRYKAQIRHRGKSINLGTFDTAEEAHAAYCKAANELHGEFANHG